MGNGSAKSSAYFVSKGARNNDANNAVNSAICCFCQKSMPEGHSLQHLKQCKKKPFDVILNCDFCGGHFEADYDLYVEHTLICKENPENMMSPCGFCKASYNMKQLAGHVEECGWNPNNIIIVCEYCEVKVPLNLHEQHLNTCKSHPNSAQLSCEFCNAKLTLRSYSEHFKVCRANPENIKIKCEFCGKKFNGNYYNQHVENCVKSHQNDDAYDPDKECAICLLEFQSRDQTVFFACAHKFHRKCAVEWAKKQNFCATCRTPFDPSTVFNVTPQ